MKWDSKLYNKSQNFVSEYGKGLLEFVPEHTGKILDIGCGTGTLTNQLADRCGYVLGIDSSDSMIEEAKKSYPHIEFATIDTLNITYENEWDIIFSNAVFHWIHNHDLLLQKIFQALKPNGKLICEFGAYGNILEIENGFIHALQKTGITYTSKFNFPTVHEFEHLLTKNGFLTEQIYSYDRPTPLKDGEQGLIHWVTQFYQSELEPLSEEQKNDVLTDMCSELKEKLWDDTCWVADYKRLRVIAAKPSFER